MSEQNQQTNETPVFNIEKIYVKNASLEVPHAPEIFRLQKQPEVEVKIGITTHALEEDFYDVSLTATVSATSDKKNVFLAEAVSSGIFLIKNIPQKEHGLVTNVTCPNILFPYAREVVSDLINRAGFPPVYLAPLNFEAMYMQQLQEQEKQAEKK